MKIQLFLKKHKSILAFTGILFVFSLWGISVFESETTVQEKQKEYPLRNMQDLIEGIITYKEVSLTAFDKGALYLELNDKFKFRLITTTMNFSYNPRDIGDFLQVSDSIYKRAENDTIFIYRKNCEYYFVLHKIINKN